MAGLRDLPNARISVMASAMASIRELSGTSAVRNGFLHDPLLPDFDARQDAIEDEQTADLPGPGMEFDLLGDRSLIAVQLPGHTSVRCSPRRCSGSPGRRCDVAASVLAGEPSADSADSNPLQRPGGHLTRPWGSCKRSRRTVCRGAAVPPVRRSPRRHRTISPVRWPHSLARQLDGDRRRQATTADETRR